MGRVYAFENGVLVLRNIPAEFLNAFDVRQKVDIFGQSLCQTKRFSQTRFLGFRMVPS